VNFYTNARLTAKIKRDILFYFGKQANFCLINFTLLFITKILFNDMVFLAFAEGIQLLPDFSLFIHIALILLMIWILNRTFFRPINRVIEAREKNEGRRFTEAEEILQKVEAKREKYKTTMLEARSEGYELIEKERNEAVEQRQLKVSAAKDEVEQMVANEKEELLKQTAEAKAVIAKEAEVMADKISATILKAA
jgi:F-type H+-transporting ATPase subunit b